MIGLIDGPNIVVTVVYAIYCPRSAETTMSPTILPIVSFQVHAGGAPMYP